MVDKAICDALIERMSKMPTPQQQRVLSFAKSLQADLPKGAPTARLLKFAGKISAQDCSLMEDAIEEGCEQVSSNEW